MPITIGHLSVDTDGRVQIELDRNAKTAIMTILNAQPMPAVSQTPAPTVQAQPIRPTVQAVPIQPTPTGRRLGTPVSTSDIGALPAEPVRTVVLPASPNIMAVPMEPVYPDIPKDVPVPRAKRQYHRRTSVEDNTSHTAFVLTDETVHRGTVLKVLSVDDADKARVIGIEKPGQAFYWNDETKAAWVKQLGASKSAVKRMSQILYGIITYTTVGEPTGEA